MLNKRRAQSPNWRHRGQQICKFSCNQQQQHQEQQYHQHEHQQNISTFENNNIRFGAIGSHLNNYQSNGINKQGFRSYCNAPLTFGNFIDLKKFEHQTDSDANAHAHGRQQLPQLNCNERHVMNATGDIQSTIIAMRNYRQRPDPFWQPLLCFNDIKDELKWEKDWNRRALDIDGNDRFLLEIDRGLNGYITRYPRCISRAYHSAAQNYAVYGFDFFDFPHLEHFRNAYHPPRLFGCIHRAKMFQNGRYHKALRFDATEPATFNLNSASFPPLPTRTNDDQLQ